jgi:16S rRNA (adenine1518-N6/adenine1519-N6)-dimethyltransferase
MPIYKPSELLEFLKGLGAVPKKGLSQNFLIDSNIIHKILASANLLPGDLVIEIGPGPGCLTEALVSTDVNVIAIEKDVLLAKALERLQTPETKLQILTADVLECPIERILAEHLKPGQKAKVIANLPYHITTPIITKLIKMRDLISDLVLMVQEEVARRFIGKPCSKEYSSLTVFLHYYSLPQYLFKVSRNCFYPSPKVDSAVVKLSLSEPPKVSNEEHFFRMTRTAFEHRRKMLRRSLNELYAPNLIEQALAKMGKPVTSRPEELNLQELLELFEGMAPQW